MKEETKNETWPDEKEELIKIITVAWGMYEKARLLNWGFLVLLVFVTVCWIRSAIA